MYFKDFPKIKYETYRLPDITIRTILNQKIKSNVYTWEPYRIKDGEKPEDIAYNLYGDANLHWVIFFLNDITNPVDEWLMSVDELNRYVSKKYGNPNAVHHYEYQGVWVNSDYPSAQPITNLNHEDALNEERREIKLLLPEYIARLREELKDILINA